MKRFYYITRYNIVSGFAFIYYKICAFPSALTDTSIRADRRTPKIDADTVGKCNMIRFRALYM